MPVGVPTHYWRSFHMKDNLKQRTWCIYKHTLLLDCDSRGKSYIGQTCTVPKQRWMKEGYGYKNQVLFYSAIKKYGWENFSHEILEDGISSIEEANEREIYWISL